MRSIILASSSPRRYKLLKQIGLNFTVDTIKIPENLKRRMGLLKLAKTISLDKARMVAGRHKDAVIIAADTFGVLDGRVLGKPDNAQEAREMLGLMNGKCHNVITGFTIMDTATGRVVTRAVETRVYFRKLRRKEIEAYVRSGEPLDKAGAYAIQGLGALLVEKIEGDYSNVIGLPLAALCQELKKFGINILN